ncbi:Uu.00g069880.m01.CDS01 [Anthostomella pinea]|uniref:Uu.00g069880.m01.CDS01 n=1 Tax=Anthostomella pinea TaxID=933095 RepID=A0AAI8VUL2_9PEZI|nr:Uu.00g069880.m01.CDS01 [Anthostomella pinea]
MAAIQQLRMASAISALFPRIFSTTFTNSFRSTVLYTHQAQESRFPSIPSLSIAIPAAISSIPSLLGDIWDGILRAVPKKKTSHMKKRHRQMAGKALQDVTNLNKCPACGKTKKMHTLCPTCMGQISGMLDRDFKAHITDIFSLAATPTALLSASGSSTLHIHATAQPSIPLAQSISGAHKLGCHHIAASNDGKVAASAGFAGDVKIWKVADSGTGDWEPFGELDPSGRNNNGGAVNGSGNGNSNNSKGAGEVWAVALSEDGQYLAATTYDGRINVWDLLGDRSTRLREYETGSAGAGSFGLCVDLSRDGKFTASGHQSGAVYVFNNDTGRLQYSLPGLVKPVRAVAFSPAGTRLAAAGDSGVIAIYDTKHGEHVSNLTGHAAWITSIDWSDTGEYLLSGAFDGKVKVWSIDQSACVATHSETDKALWAVKWLPKTARNEMFVTAGANRSLTFYREATGA